MALASRGGEYVYIYTYIYLSHVILEGIKVGWHSSIDCLSLSSVNFFDCFCQDRQGVGVCGVIDELFS